MADTRVDDSGPSLVAEKPEEKPGSAASVHSARLSTPEPTYRLYKRRFFGLVAMTLLNLVGGMNWPWFGPISNDLAAEFGFSLTRVNWLANIVAVIYLPISLLIPPFVARFGLRRCCDVGAASLILTAWIRYAGTVESLSVNGSYALLIVGQLFAAIAQPIFQVLGPKFSENWFDLSGRTTATMIISLGNPVGGAVGQLLSPMVGDTRQSILIAGIICTAITPLVFLVGDAPPIPPTYAASQKTPSLLSLLRNVAGLSKAAADDRMTRRERFDFVIVTLVFGVLVASVNNYSILTAQIFEPVGYSSDISGLMGACLLLTGLVAAIVTAPLFDRVFTHHLALTAKVLVPIMAIAWLSMIWAVTPHNTGGLFAIMAILGVSGLTMLPVGLELACDLTRNAEASSCLLWFTANLLCVIFVLAQNALRAGPDADPPLNMRRALIFNAAFVMTICSLIFFIHGKQVRKEIDERMHREAQQASATRRDEEQTPS